MTSILIVAPNWIGDTLLAQPLFARLAERLPGATIDALASPWTAPLLARMPEITGVIESPFDHGQLRLRERWRFGRSLRENRYDQAIVLPNSFKSALIPFFADIPLRAGFVGESRYGILNLVHRLDNKALPLMAERYAQLAEAPGSALRRPLARSRLQVDQANLLITVSRLGLNRRHSVVVLCPGAEYGPAKRWPVMHFAQLARDLAAAGHVVWLIGSAKDRPLGDDIVREAGAGILNLCGRTDLASSIDLLSLARVVVSNDSGLMHVAAALGRPVVALYGSSSPAHTPPLSILARIVKIEGLPCSPCYARECPLGHFKCMNDLTPRRVLDEVRAAGGADL
ncbi:MAG: lipopolysaccharide heptosyltransferase II [Betaproteobacteria bacterium]|nr:lipopolysaccharide heptosyltransferase II [Betaproteobacteria bacterium]